MGTIVEAPAQRDLGGGSGVLAWILEVGTAPVQTTAPDRGADRITAFMEQPVEMAH